MDAAPVEPTVSVIVCTRNRPELLHGCIASVLRGDALPAEIVVVDDSDAEDPVPATMGSARCEVRYHWARTGGLSAAENFAVREAKGDLLLFTQDDAEVDRAWLPTLSRAVVEAGPQAIVTGRVRPGHAEAEGGFVSDITTETERTVYRGRTDQDVLFALNMGMYRGVVDGVGPFDERLGPGTPFPAAEDSDYALRALDAGYAIVYEPAAVVYHRAWRGSEAFVPFRWTYGVARGGFYAKHILAGDRLVVGRLLRTLSRHLAPTPRLLLRDRRAAAGHLALSAGVLVGAARWARLHRGEGRRARPDVAR